MSRIVPLAGMLAVLLTTGSASATPHRPHARSRVAPARGTQFASGSSRQFLGSSPIGPLAVVRGGVIKKPATRDCRTWGPVGSSWRELDAFGQVAGVVTIQSREYYPYSNCDELSVRRLSGRPGAGVFVDALAHYQAPRAKAWQPGASDLAALEQLARTHQEGIEDLAPKIRVPFSRRVLFFEWSRRGDRFAVVGGRSLIVLSFNAGQWDVVHEVKPDKMRSQDKGYAPLMVTDMDGDNRPEIVVHTEEGTGEWYGDFTLSLGNDDGWSNIGPGIFGSTA